MYELGCVICDCMLEFQIKAIMVKQLLSDFGAVGFRQ